MSVKYLLVISRPINFENIKIYPMLRHHKRNVIPLHCAMTNTDRLSFDEIVLSSQNLFNKI